ncbi:MAG: molecular chaperone [Acidobacteriota bacterium]
MTLEDFVSREQARRDIYRLLAACFCLPEKEALLTERVFDNLSRAIKRVCPAAHAFVGKMKIAASTATEEDLRVEYARLFVGPQELLAPPYGSVYLERERSVMGSSTIEVMKIYEGEGLFIDRESRELPDHISVELEFVYYLISRELEALEAGKRSEALDYIQKQKHFLREYVIPWAPSLCADIRENTESEFFASLADCLRSLLQDSESELQEPPKENLHGESAEKVF